VRQVRRAPITVQNVVTYDVVVQVPNPGMKLLPGMTANVAIVITTKDDVLRVPNAALRFRPDRPEGRAEGQGTAGAAAGGRKGPAGPAVWVLEKGAPKRVGITPGVSDGIWTEVAAELQDGQQVIIEAVAKGRKASQSGGPRMF
jgi:HlyD family secretion protein